MSAKLKLRQLQSGGKNKQILRTRGALNELVFEDENISVLFKNFTSSGIINTEDSENDIRIKQTSAGITLSFRSPDDITSGIKKTVSNIGTQDISINSNTIPPNKSSIYLWNGTQWNVISSSVITGVTGTFDFTATSNQTVFLIPAPIINTTIMFYLNGIRSPSNCISILGNSVIYAPILNQGQNIRTGDRVTIDVITQYISGNQEFLSTANQTVFNIANPVASANSIIFFRNGIRLPANSISAAGTLVTYTPSGNGNQQLQVNDRISITY